jgi:hypothetical protein
VAGNLQAENVIHTKMPNQTVTLTSPTHLLDQGQLTSETVQRNSSESR